MEKNKPLKALLLAAGFGTRLGKLTKNKPKCLMEINGKALLGIWLHKLEGIGCEEVIINTHYLANQVKEFIRSFRKLNMKISLVHEEVLLGTASTLLKNKMAFKNSKVLLIHADNYTNMNFEKFIEAHNKKDNKSPISMVTFNSNNPTSCGIVEVNSKGLMIDFEEKPIIAKSNIANGAIYYFDFKFLDYLDKLNSKYQIKDFSKDVIPLLKNKIQTWHTKDYIIDIGSPSQLFDAQTKNFIN